MSVLAFLALLVSLAAIVRPIPRIGLSTRKRAVACSFVFLFLVSISTGPNTNDTDVTVVQPIAPVEAPVEATDPGDVLTSEDLLAGSAEYVIHEVSDFSFGTIRSRISADVTTPETDPARVVEALMRAAMEIQLGGDMPDVVDVSLWEIWPRPEPPSQGEFEEWDAKQREDYLRQGVSIRSITYAPDRCGWTGEVCDGTLWDDVTAQEMPAWMLRACPRIMERPCGWWTPRW